jgi:hypothetical protein
VEKLKKIVFVCFVVISLGAAIWAYWTVKKLKSPKILALTVVPDSCQVYFNTTDFYEVSKELNSQSLIIDKLKAYKEIDEACTLLKKFDSITYNNELLKEEIDDNLIHFAAYNALKDWIVSFNTKQLGNEKKVLEELNAAFRAKVQKQDFSTSVLLNKSEIYFNVANGIVCFSNSKTILSKAFSTKSNKFYNSNAYIKFENTLKENNLCNLYINAKQNKNLSKKTNAYYFLNESILAGNMVLEPSEFKVSGNLVVDSNHVLAALTNEESQSCETIFEYLPTNLNYFEAYAFGSYASLRKKMQIFFPGKNKKFWVDKNEKALYNLEKEFNENISNQLACFELNGLPAKFIMIGSVDSIKAKDQFKLLSDSSFSFNQHIIYNFSSGKSQKIFEPLFSLKINCMTIHDGQLLFSERIDHLQQLLQALQTKDSLEANNSFISYKNDNFLSKYNYMLYYSPHNYEEQINHVLNFKNTSYTNPINNLKHFSYTIVNGKTDFDFRLQIFNQAGNRTDVQNALWSSNLDTLANGPAYSFINHITDENEIIIQDKKNNLYLLNVRGGKLWQRNIGQKIRSSIYMVDVFKNEKFQMMFNTDDFIYLVDRNGKDVKGFPVKLPKKASSAISLIDYNQDRNYRIFVACEDGKIYNYNEKGYQQEGFVPVKTDKRVQLPIQYFKVGSSEYLVALDVEGKIYTFGRKGQMKINLKNRSIQDSKVFYLNSTNILSSSSLIYYDDKNSLINKINFNDKKDVLKLDIESGNANTNFVLIDENREIDLLISQDQNLYAFNINGELLYQHKSSQSIDKAMFYSDESKMLYFTLNETRSELEINDAHTKKSTIVKANALPMIMNLFNDNVRYMIITYGNQVSCLALD